MASGWFNLSFNFNKKYEVLDDNIKKEVAQEKIVKNSGIGEQIAHMAKGIRSKQ